MSVSEDIHKRRMEKDYGFKSIQNHSLRLIRIRATNLYALGLEHDFQPGDTELDRVAARILNNMCAELKFLSMSE